eukprot:scaffold1637_cov253-Pinguiococcus_pyrenoidosus.AAC.11
MLRGVSIYDRESYLRSDLDLPDKKLLPRGQSIGFAELVSHYELLLPAEGRPEKAETPDTDAPLAKPPEAASDHLFLSMLRYLELSPILAKHKAALAQQLGDNFVAVVCRMSPELVPQTVRGRCVCSASQVQEDGLTVLVQVPQWNSASKDQAQAAEQGADRKIVEWVREARKRRGSSTKILFIGEGDLWVKLQLESDFGGVVTLQQRDLAMREATTTVRSKKLSPCPRTEVNDSLTLSATAQSQDDILAAFLLADAADVYVLRDAQSEVRIEPK